MPAWPLTRTYSSQLEGYRVASIGIQQFKSHPVPNAGSLCFVTALSLHFLFCKTAGASVLHRVLTGGPRHPENSGKFAALPLHAATQLHQELQLSLFPGEPSPGNKTKSHVYCSLSLYPWYDLSMNVFSRIYLKYIVRFPKMILEPCSSDTHF